MGSDRAPLPEIEGAVKAAASGDFEVVLVGDEARLKAALEAYPKRGRISIVHASEVITMHDLPAIIRRKRDSSLVVALRLLKQGEVDAVVSAGNTGAVVVGSRVMLGFIEGVARAAICPIMPTAKDPVVILDQGANVDCSARHLCEFAEMGTVYSRLVLGVKSPRVGLLNIGAETVKGNELAKTVHHSLTVAQGINFIGNIEPKAMFEGNADVVICDGFVGNMVLKTSEAAAWLMSNLIKRELKSTLTSRIGAALCRGAFKRLKKTVDANEHPGAPLLGVNGVVTILHGATSAKGVANGIRGTAQAVREHLNDHIREGVAELRQIESMFTKRESVG